MLVRTRPRTAVGGALTTPDSTFEWIRCKFCEPHKLQTRADKCLALQTLESLRVELEEECRDVQEQEVRATAPWVWNKNSAAMLS